MKKKKKNMSNQDLDQSNPSGGVQKEVPQVSKKELKNVKAWAKKIIATT